MFVKYISFYLFGINNCALLFSSCRIVLTKGYLLSINGEIEEGGEHG